jgi:hypothetical protein
MARAGSGKGSGGSSDFPLVFIERIDVAVDSQDITFSGLDGEADGAYLLSLSIVDNSVGGASISIRPNGVTTDQKAQSFGYSASGSGVAGYTTLYAGSGVGGGNNWTSSLRMQCKAGTQRSYNGSIANGDQAATFGLIFSGTWNDIATAITSLVLHASAAAGIGAGSYVTLYKIPNG